MALSKSIETPSGATATYWRIVQGTFDMDTGKLVAHVYGYASEQARRAGKAPLMEKRVEFPLDATSPIRAQWDALFAAKYPAMTAGFPNGTETTQRWEERRVADMTGGEIFYKTESFEITEDVPFVDKFFSDAEAV